MLFKYGVTGLMSGSSLDGVDLAYCEFIRESSGWFFSIVAAETIPYPDPLRAKLDMACNWDMERIKVLDKDLGTHYSILINDFHKRNRLAPICISSHGHTILHEPLKGITFQAGHGGIIAKATGIQVVNDFRREDVSQGGQGAPLVPVGDRLLFGNFASCVNLGGFANISYEDQHGRRIAYDICPVNMALNWLAGRLGKAYDADGEMARSGIINESLLNALNNLDYYRVGPPKSLGKEWFLSAFLPLINNSYLSEPDRLATVVEHIAIQVSGAIDHPDAGEFEGEAGYRSGKTLVTGGGAMNQFLMERMVFHTINSIEIPEKLIVQYKEAMVFAFLGMLKLEGEVNCFSSVTGGKNDLSTGIIHLPNN